MKLILLILTFCISANASLLQKSGVLPPSAVNNQGAGWAGWAIVASNSPTIITVQRTNSTHTFPTNERRWTIVGAGAPQQVLNANLLPSPNYLWLKTYTNILARTNGKSWTMFSSYVGHPLAAPSIVRNPDCLLNTNDATGISVYTTALEPPTDYGALTATLITRRHAILRGHGFGWPGEGSHTNGDTRIWFLTSSNTTVEARVQGSIGFTPGTAPGGHDYNIVVFTEDVPDSITPIPIITADERRLYLGGWPYKSTPSDIIPFFNVCRHYLIACVTTDPVPIEGFGPHSTVGGDSGSPRVVLLPTATGFRLAYIGHVSGGTELHGASAHLIDSVNTMSIWAGLNPENYKPTYINFRDYIP